MKPKKPERSDAEDLFRARLENIIDLKHPLVRLAHATDWGAIADSELGARALSREDHRAKRDPRFSIDRRS